MQSYIQSCLQFFLFFVLIVMVRVDETQTRLVKRKTGLTIECSGNRADGFMTQSTHLRDHVLKGLHDLGALGFLEVGEAAGDDDDS